MPLKADDEAIPVDMQSIFEGVCERASYDLRIDYTKPCPAPDPSVEDQAWLEDLLMPYKH